MLKASEVGLSHFEPFVEQTVTLCVYDAGARGIMSEPRAGIRLSLVPFTYPPPVFRTSESRFIQSSQVKQ
jgi:hypothetical protein